MELLVDCIRNPAFLDWEVSEQVCLFLSLSLYWHVLEILYRSFLYFGSYDEFPPVQLEKVKAVISEYAKNPQHFLLEAVHSAGYSEPYANSLMATETTVNRLQHVLEEFVAVSI